MNILQILPILPSFLLLITNEILATGTQPLGQPDPTEDGLVGPGDRVTVTNMILAGTVCN